jgi:uncharacterized membrane protein
MDTGKSALGLDGNLAAALGYPIGILAIVCLIMEKENRFVRFHALQSILWLAVYIVVIIALMILGVIIGILGVAASAASSSAGAGVGIIGMLVWLLWLAVFLGWLIMLIMAAVKAYGGIEYKLPIVGNMAEKWTK